MRRRNPSGVVEWAKAHPWMTFFLLSSAIAVPVELYRASQAAKAAPLRRVEPVDPLSQPTEPPRFVPGVVD